MAPFTWKLDVADALTEDPAAALAADMPAPERPPGKVIVVMPAMNAAATLRQTVDAIPRDWVDEVVLVDDHSMDVTVELARRLPLHLVWHPHNAGYGANQKTCYPEALPARRGRRGDAPSGRAVRTELDPQYGRADSQ